MDDHRFSKSILFGLLFKRHLAHGTKIRWWDQVKRDLNKFGIEERGRFRLEQDRARWRGYCKAWLDRVTRRRLDEDDMRRRARLAVNANGSVR